MRAALIAVGVALTVAVGLSRVYLGVHYLSDVSGGWALGVAAFAGCAAIAMVVAHLRQNQRRRSDCDDPARQPRSEPSTSCSAAPG